MDALLRFWSERAPREKAILLGGGLVVAAAVIYLLLIEPAWTGIQRLERGLPGARAQAAQLQGLLVEATALKSRPQVAAVSAEEARATLEKSLAAVGLKAARIQPLAEGSLQLSLANVPYATWSTWLADTERTLGARAISVKATRTATAGNADIDLVLRLARR